MIRQLKLPEVARRLGVSEKTARRYVKAGALPSVFVGNAYRVSEKDVEEYLERARVTPGKAPAPPSSTQPQLNGFEEERREDTEYIHFDTILDRIGAAGNAAREVVTEWRGESARMLVEGRTPGRYRTLEMRSFHNELSAIFITSLRMILEAARQGTISVGYSRDEPQDLADDPSLWPRSLRGYLYDAGSHIAVLPAVIGALEREWAARGFESAPLAAQRGAAIEGSLPEEITSASEWQGAIERAREEAGIR